MIYTTGVSFGNGVLLFLHKIIELVLLCSFSSFLFILGTNKFSAYFFLLLLVLCPYLSKLLNYFYASAYFSPLVNDLLIFLFPPIVSIRVASYLLFTDYRLKLANVGDKFCSKLSLIYVFLIFIIYTIAITVGVIVILRIRHHSRLRKYYSSLQNGKDSTFGFQIKQTKLYTNKYTLISEK